MSLTKKIPAKTVSITADWVYLDGLTYTRRFEQIRLESKRNLMSECYWCKHEFEYGEKISLAKIKGKGTNKVFCHDCASTLLGANA